MFAGPAFKYLQMLAYYGTHGMDTEQVKILL